MLAHEQGEGVVSTLKHSMLNCNETNRHWLAAIIDPDAHRESDLLAFEIAFHRALRCVARRAARSSGDCDCGALSWVAMLRDPHDSAQLDVYRRVVTPAGFEPAISTLKGLRPGPG